jgi:hypothetical protein
VARLRFNNLSSFGTTNPITLSSGSTATATWSSTPGFPTIAAPDFAVIVVEPDTANEEILYLTAFTSGATTGTVLRAQEGTTGITHTATAWVHGPTALDFLQTIPQFLTAS